MTPRRTAGLALGGYVLATVIALAGSSVPGGDYEVDKIGAYLGGAHVLPVVLGSLLMVAGLSLLLVARHVREAVPGAVGGLAADLAVVASAAGVVGGMAQAGLSIALAEGGPAVTGGLPLPVTYAVGEVVNLLAVCAPAFAVGALAVVLAARYPMPPWLRVLTVVGAVGGLTAPLYFTFFAYLLWALVLGGWLVGRQVPRPVAPPVVSTAGSVAGP